LLGCPREDQPATSGVRIAHGGSDTVVATSAAPPVLRVDLPSSETRRQVPLGLTPDILRRAARDGELLVQLADGTRYAVAVEQAKPSIAGRWTVVGRVRTRLGIQSAVFTFDRQAIFGVLPQPDGPLLSITTVRGVVQIGRDPGLVPEGVDPRRHPDFLDPREPAVRAPGKSTPTPLSGAPARATPATAALTEVQVDVLGLYSDELVDLRGSVEAAETDVASTIAIATQAHVDSGSRVRLVLAGARQVSVPAGIFNDAALGAITDNTLAGVDLEALRDATAADLVMLVRPYTSGDYSCGIAWLNGAQRQRSDVYPEYGFSVSNSDCSQYVVAHELAHNMGSAHDRVTETDSEGSLAYGAYLYSFGFQQEGPPKFATIMSYFSPLVGYFSNPDLDACGAPCGVVDSADNVRSLNNMATAIAAFRGPPGTISIADIERMEPAAGEMREQRIPVLLSGAAPPGGVTLAFAVVGGTATGGIDFEVPAGGTLFIPEGGREAPLTVVIVGDDQVEPDETVIFRLSDVIGAGLYDAEATMTIGNDDPRLQLAGAVRFPPGEALPENAFVLDFQGMDGDLSGPSKRLWISPPDFRFAIPVIKDSEIFIEGQVPEPLMAPYTSLGVIHEDTERDYYVLRGAVLESRLAVPDGDSLSDIAGPVYADLEWTKGRYRYSMTVTYASPSYSIHEIFPPGTLIDLTVFPPPPYFPYIERIRLDRDFEHTVSLSTSNTLAVRGPLPVVEGNGVLATVTFQLATAATSPVTLDYRTRSRSAAKDMDYHHVSGTLTFASGETTKQVDIQMMDDKRYEPDEYFQVLTENLQGAVTSNAVQRIDVLDDDARTGGPGQKQPVP
jgi:hypothetical protein